MLGSGLVESLRNASIGGAAGMFAAGLFGLATGGVGWAAIVAGAMAVNFLQGRRMRGMRQRRDRQEAVRRELRPVIDAALGDMDQALEGVLVDVERRLADGFDARLREERDRTRDEGHALARARARSEEEGTQVRSQLETRIARLRALRERTVALAAAADGNSGDLAAKVPAAISTGGVDSASAGE